MPVLASGLGDDVGERRGGCDPGWQAQRELSR